MVIAASVAVAAAFAYGVTMLDAPDDEIEKWNGPQMEFRDCGLPFESYYNK